MAGRTMQELWRQLGLILDTTNTTLCLFGWPGKKLTGPRLEKLTRRHLSPANFHANYDSSKDHEQVVKELAIAGITTTSQLLRMLREHLFFVLAFEKHEVVAGQNTINYYRGDLQERYRRGVFLTHTGLIRHSLYSYKTKQMKRNF